MNKKYLHSHSERVDVPHQFRGKSITVGAILYQYCSNNTWGRGRGGLFVFAAAYYSSPPPQNVLLSLSLGAGYTGREKTLLIVATSVAHLIFFFFYTHSPITNSTNGFTHDTEANEI